MSWRVKVVGRGKELEKEGGAKRKREVGRRGTRDRRRERKKEMKDEMKKERK